eukprot:1903607-Ditylum_brightwellii.AAC.1
MTTARDAARLLTWRAAMMKDAGEKNTKEAAIAKLLASEAATMCAHQSMQRDIIGMQELQRYEGTSEKQHLVIAGDVIKEYQG